MIISLSFFTGTPLGSTTAPSFGFTFGFSTDDEPEMPSSDPEKTESQPLSIPDGMSIITFVYIIYNSVVGYITHRESLTQKLCYPG